jgi:hypothetical protein
VLAKACVVNQTGASSNKLVTMTNKQSMVILLVWNPTCLVWSPTRPPEQCHLSCLLSLLSALLLLPVLALLCSVPQQPFNLALMPQDVEVLDQFATEIRKRKHPRPAHIPCLFINNDFAARLLGANSHSNGNHGLGDTQRKNRSLSLSPPSAANCGKANRCNAKNSAVRGSVE